MTSGYFKTQRSISPTARFGASKTKRFYKKVLMDNPGPGAYEPAHRHRTSSPNYTINKSKHELDVTQLEK